MVNKKSSARRGGPPKKAPGGLDKVLFVRADQELLDQLEALRQRRRKSNRGVVLSTADVARSILWEAIERDAEES